MARNKYIAWIVIAALVTIPGVYLRLSNLAHPLLDTQPYLVALAAGIAVLGASFLLLWACDAAQAEISQMLALAIVALIAVLPEYAVDMYFTWQAGQHPQSDYAHYAIANMTGANRLLIGVAWSAIAIIFWFKTRQAVRLSHDRRTELFFLGIATAYAFVIPIKGNLAWYDCLVFLAIYVWYIVIAGRRPCEECDVDGPAEMLMALPTTKRRLATLGMFVFAALVILANAEIFSEGLIATGKAFHINEFLLVQWLAPIASEAPEFVVAIMFALRGNAGMALGSLLSSKLNQWTLLVGTIPGVYALSSKQIALPMNMGSFQMHEIMLTAAQSLFAVVLLAALRLRVGHAVLLFVLFIAQLILPEVAKVTGWTPMGLHPANLHPLFSLLYVVAALTLFLNHPDKVANLRFGIKDPAAGEALPVAEEEDEPRALSHV